VVAVETTVVVAVVQVMDLAETTVQIHIKNEKNDREQFSRLLVQQ
jgi:hypothetical protein